MMPHRTAISAWFLPLACWLVVSGLTLSVQGAETRRRLVFLGPESARILELAIVGGRFSVEETRKRYADGVFQSLDRNGDGQLNGEEAEAIPADGRLRFNGPMLGSDWGMADHSPQNGHISPEELLSFFNKVGGPAVAIVQRPPRLSQSVRLDGELDLNHDGRIDAVEIQQGFEALKSFDFDDDETLSVAELQPFPLSVRQAQRQAQVDSDPSPLHFISTPEECETVAEVIWQRYFTGGRDEIAGTQIKGSVAFDRNGDGRCSREEIADSLKILPAEETLTVILEAGSVVRGKERAVRFAHPTLNLGGVPVEFRAENKASQLGDSTKLYKIRFRTSDGDKDGLLDESEFGGLQADVPFAAVDLNHDGNVTLPEIDAYFSLDGLSRQRQYVVTLSNERITLFDILDARGGVTVGEKTFGDQRLTPREFLEGAQRLLAYDRDQDKALTALELVDNFRVAISQPELLDETPLSDQMMMTTGNRPTMPESDSGPLWFRRMDRNGDGELTWREFLGPRETFVELDRNSDGLIEEAEATDFK
ncbi:EF-hand domain-containing protein [Planctomicrobium piriforme]|uniref:EF hand n=1 Tax=Planctomicrobium piriforme TaxID=1576369 RepID=A0A1I3LYV8_9PLAN|nr:hypothetical protein [Planctomicrobium piriforme]SFI89867.1 EF hand [Planctomicrobium piriforme]